MIAMLRKIFARRVDDAPTRRDAERAAQHSDAIISDVRSLRSELFGPTGNVIIDEIAGYRHRGSTAKVANRKVRR